MQCSVCKSELHRTAVSVTSAMAGINPSGTVQDVASKGEVPENYIHKESDRGALNSPPMAAPLIDLDLISSSSNSRSELEKLRHGLQSWGCFQVRFHFTELSSFKTLISIGSCGDFTKPQFQNTLHLDLMEIVNCFELDSENVRILSFCKIWSGFTGYKSWNVI